MESTRLWIVSPRQMHRLARKLGEDSRVSWCYLGSDVHTKERLRRLLPGGRLVSVGAPLNRFAGELRQPFLDWVAQIGSHQRHRLLWWASRLASSSPLQTDCFLLVCYSQLVQSWIAQAHEAFPRVVVIEDPWLARVLRMQARGYRDVKVLAGGWFRLGWEALIWGMRAMAAKTIFLAWASWMLWRVRRTFPHPPPRGFEPDLSGQRPAILLYTWIDGRCFVNGEAFHDPYTGRLEAMLTRHGHLVRRLTPLHLGIRSGFLRQLRRFSTQFIVTPRYATVADIARASSAWFRIDAIRRVCRFQQTDYAPLLWREVLLERGTLEFSGCQLWSLSLRRVVRSVRAAIRLVIYPFENQPWEKMLCLAFRDEAPEVSLIGYQHSCVSPFLLNYGRGQSEPGAIPLPHVIVANGPLSRAVLREGGWPPNQVWNGGALRYEYLLSRGSSRRTRAGAPPRVLITLPISPAQAATLVHDLVDVFSTPLEISGGGRVAFVFKGHPRLPIRRWLRGRRTLPAWFSVTEDPLSVLWPRVDILLYIPPTASWMEAYAAGVPVVKYCGELLDIDSADRLPSGMVATCSRDTVRSTLERLVVEQTWSVDVSQRRREVIERIFSPVQEDVWVTLARPSPEVNAAA